MRMPPPPERSIHFIIAAKRSQARANDYFSLSHMEHLPYTKSRLHLAAFRIGSIRATIRYAILSSRARVSELHLLSDR